MASASIHQVIHGYRDGHRLLSGSIALGTEAARTMLVLSDMSGPSMQSGFDEYLTAYPLQSTDLFVFAKTWYAPEMQRPGCVWTHSLLLPRAQVSNIPVARLLASLRRPQIEGVDRSATAPILLDDALTVPRDSDFGDNATTTLLVGAVFGQSRPVIVSVDTAVQVEPVFLRLWDALWPAEKARFAFCTGALMPRSVSGALFDLQAVPRSIPPSQFRKSASAALVVDLRTPSPPEAWAKLVLDGSARGNANFCTWIEAAAGSDAGRGVVPSLIPIFSQWHAPNWSARAVLASIVSVKEIERGIMARLVGMVFDRAGSDEGAGRRRELLQSLCEHRDTDLSSLGSLLEAQARRLFDESRAEGCAMILSLLGAELTELGERVLRSAVLLLKPNDVERFGDAQTPFLPTIVGANPTLAQSPVLWSRVGARSTEVLAQLSNTNLSDEYRGGIIDVILTSGHDVPVDALVRFGGKITILRTLTALAAGQLQLSWQWRSALSVQSDAVLEWLESHPSLMPRELELGSHFLSPKANQSRLAKVWQTGVASSAETISPRVAAFGLALALAEGNVRSTLLAVCFQPTYDAAGNSRIEYEEWDWLREQTPPVSWWRDWDRCERLAAALARLLEAQSASLETVFGIVYSRQAIRKVTAFLDDDRNTRHYLRSLRKTAELSSFGTREQRDALL